MLPLLKIQQYFKIQITNNLGLISKVDLENIVKLYLTERLHDISDEPNKSVVKIKGKVNRLHGISDVEYDKLKMGIINECKKSTLFLGIVKVVTDENPLCVNIIKDILKEVTFYF